MEQLWLAIIPIVVGGIVTIALRLLNTKAEKAKQEVDRSATAVSTIKTAMEGLSIQADNLRKDYEREKARADAVEEELRRLRR